MSYPHRLKELRSKRSISQKSMAELLKTTQQQYSKYENGQQELPVRHVVTICNEYGVSSDWLLGIEKKPFTVGQIYKATQAATTKRKVKLGRYLGLKK